MVGRQVEGSVSEDTAIERRALQMKYFRDTDVIRRVIAEQVTVATGQIIGRAFIVKKKEGRLPDGTTNISLLTLGDFEAVAYKSGEVMQSSGVYFPRYFAETLEAALEKTPQGIDIAIEIVVEPTGRKPEEGGILYSWGVKRLLSRMASDPLERIKRDLAARNMLRLPPPQSAGAVEYDPLAYQKNGPVEAAVETGGGVDPDTAGAAPEAAGSDGAAPAAADAKHGKGGKKAA